MGTENTSKLYFRVLNLAANWKKVEKGKGQVAQRELLLELSKNEVPRSRAGVIAGKWKGRGR